MKIELHIDPSLTEPTVSIYAPSRTAEIDALLDRLTDPAGPLLGFRSDGTAVPLELDAVLRFYGEDKAVHAQTVEGTYLIRSRLYELEQRLDPKEYDPFHARYPGRVSELLLDIWLRTNDLSYAEVPVADMQGVNWLKKGGAFLIAKFTGKKYDKSF